MKVEKGRKAKLRKGGEGREVPLQERLLTTKARNFVHERDGGDERKRKKENYFAGYL